jgi:hypothetical protein
MTTAPHLARLDWRGGLEGDMLRARTAQGRGGSGVEERIEERLEEWRG